MSDTSHYNKLDSCCFCFNLRVGIQLIAYFTWFSCLIEIMTYMFMLYHIEVNASQCHPFSGATSTGAETVIIDCGNNSLWIVRAMIIFKCLHYLVGFIGALLMLKGISMKRPNLFNVWLVYAFISIGICVMSFGTVQSSKDSFSRLVSSTFLIYFVMVVVYYQKQLRAEIENTLPVSIITRPDQVHMSGGVSSLSHMQPKDYPPPPYSTVAAPPPPYSSVKPTSSNDPQTPADTDADTESVGPPPTYDESATQNETASTVVSEQPRSNPSTVEV